MTSFKFEAPVDAGNPRLSLTLRSEFSPQHPANTVNMCAALTVKNQVSHPHKKTLKIIIF